MRLLAATRSKGKQVEFRRLLEAAGHEVIFPDDAGIPLREELEDGLEVESSFEGNARRKAEYFAKLSGMPVIADDSGLEVISLGGAPGVRSKRWSGVDGTEAEVTAANNAELLRRLAGAPATKRTARYRCVIVYLASPTAAPLYSREPAPEGFSRKPMAKVVSATTRCFSVRNSASPSALPPQKRRMPSATAARPCKRSLVPS